MPELGSKVALMKHCVQTRRAFGERLAWFSDASGPAVRRSGTGALPKAIPLSLELQFFLLSSSGQSPMMVWNNKVELSEKSRSRIIRRMPKSNDRLCLLFLVHHLQRFIAFMTNIASKVQEDVGPRGPYDANARQ